MNQFFRRNRSSIVLFSPLILGLIFFIYSGISAFITINSTELPEDFEKAKLSIQNYKISEIDSKTNKLKWSLEAAKADLDQEQNQGRVEDVLITVYESKSPSFTIKARYALLNNKQKTIRLYDGAELRSSDGTHQLTASEIHFAQNQAEIEVRGHWQLRKNSKNIAIVTGDEGFISKDFHSIRSHGHASISESNSKLSADELIIGLDRPIVAKGHAQAVLENGSQVKASEILIYKSGEIHAKGSVEVITDKLRCYAAEMIVEANAQAKPRIATFKGNPHIVQNSRTIYADSIIYDFASQQAIIEGNVHSL